MIIKNPTKKELNMYPLIKTTLDGEEKKQTIFCKQAPYITVKCDSYLIKNFRWVDCEGVWDIFKAVEKAFANRWVKCDGLKRKDFIEDLIKRLEKLKNDKN